MFGPDLKQPNKVINVSPALLRRQRLSGIGDGQAVWTIDFTLEKTQCLPLYRYTAEGERVSNITDWAVREFNEHCRDVVGRVLRRVLRR